MAIVQANRTGLLGVLEDAQAALTRAGYSGVSCRTERVYTPDGNYYTQDICAAPGFVGGFDANLVAGGKVNLEAERAFLKANALIENPDSYFQTFGNSPTVVPIVTVGTDGKTTRNNAVVAPVKDAFFTSPTPVVAPATVNKPPENKPVAPQTPTPDPSSLLSLPQGIDSSWLWIGAAALGALFLIGGKR